MQSAPPEHPDTSPTAPSTERDRDEAKYTERDHDNMKPQDRFSYIDAEGWGHFMAGSSVLGGLRSRHYAGADLQMVLLSTWSALARKDRRGLGIWARHHDANRAIDGVSNVRRMTGSSCVKRPLYPSVRPFCIALSSAS